MERYRGIVGIYKFTNPEGLIYIGQSTNVLKRFYSHKSGGVSGAKLRASFKKFGFEKHTFELKEECDSSALLQRERFYINLYDSINNGLNMRGKKREKLISENERGAGRKKKYNVPVKLIRVPEPIIEQVVELSKPFENEVKGKK